MQRCRGQGRVAGGPTDRDAAVCVQPETGTRAGEAGQHPGRQHGLSGQEGQGGQESSVLMPLRPRSLALSGRHLAGVPWSVMWWHF